MPAQPTPAQPSDEIQLRISSTPIFIAILLLGLTTIVYADQPAGLPHRIFYLSFGITCYVVTTLGWWLEQRASSIGNWFIPLATTAIVMVLVLLLPAAAYLAPLPVLVAWGMVGAPAGLLVTVSLSVVFLLFPVQLHGSGIASLFAIAALWGVAALSWAIYRPMHQIVAWSWQNFQQVQQLLEATRDRSMQLQQVLDELMHANRQLDLLNERLSNTRLMLEEANRAKADFVAKVSHEFRTPLNMIIGLTDLLVETPDLYGDRLPGPLLQDIQIVHRNCVHLASMINDVLDISQTEVGRLTLRREWIDLTDDLRDAIEVVRPLADRRHLELTHEVATDLPQVYCDRTRIRQVLLNLLSNAARYTEQGGIHVSATRQDQFIVIRVADTGPGIQPDDFVKIFEPFYQGEDYGWRDRGGSGLGLAISKQFVELHSGHIWVESEVGVGSTFVFKLPVAPPLPPQAASNRWIDESWIWVERQNRMTVPSLPYQSRIIICDAHDELSMTLADGGDRAEAIELVHVHTLDEVTVALDECPAHALILNAPNRSTLFTWLEEARTRFTDTPVVGYVVPQSVDHALASGAWQYLIKPITRADLQRALVAVDRPLHTILVVDDNHDFRQLLERMLHLIEPTMTVIGAANVEQALDILHTTLPDHIILDIAMPHFDGWHLLESKNRDPRLAGIPVTIVSAQDPVEQAATSGMMVAMMGDGIPTGKLLACALEFSMTMLTPLQEPVPELE